MAEASKRNPRVTAKICEHMTYAGREAYKRLRTNVLIALENLESEPKKKCRVIGITSAQPSEGKSTTSVNLAYTMAELGKAVLLIDADMRRPSVHTNVGISQAPGLSEVLQGYEDLKNAVVTYKSSTDNTAFDIIPGGNYPDNPSELLNSGRFRKLVEVVSTVYDVVVIDLPPVNAVIDAINVSKCTEGLIVVIRENHCPRGVLMGCMDQLKYAKANVLGFVINGVTGGSGKKYQYTQQYAYTPSK